MYADDKICKEHHFIEKFLLYRNHQKPFMELKGDEGGCKKIEVFREHGACPEYALLKRFNTKRIFQHWAQKSTEMSNLLKQRGTICVDFGV